jgi:hypothetical protein
MTLSSKYGYPVSRAMTLSTKYGYPATRAMRPLIQDIPILMTKS